jgi:hypothetical protein
VESEADEALLNKKRKKNPPQKIFLKKYSRIMNFKEEVFENIIHLVKLFFLNASFMAAL